MILFLVTWSFLAFTSFGVALLNYLLIPRYGMMGAAWSTFISYGILAVLNLLVNQRFWHIPYEYMRILKLGVVWVLIYYTGLQISNLNVILSIVLKLFLLACYPILLLVLRFFKPEELRKFSQVVQARTKIIKLPW